MTRYLIIFLIILSVPSMVFAEGVNAQDSREQLNTVRGKVLEVISETEPLDNQSDETGFNYITQIVRVKILNGEYKGEEFIIENDLSNNPIFDIKVESGDEIILVVEEGEDGLVQFFISDFVRDRYLIYLLVAFALLLIIVGKVKGIKALVTLLITAIIILKFMIPLILKGYNPIWVSVVSSIIITVITLLIIAGINIKSISAMLGTAAGVIFAAALAYLIGTCAKLTGFSSEEASMLLYIPQQIQFDFRGLLFAGIIIGTLGAVMDVGMSIASSMYEMRKIHPEISPMELIKSGLNVGRDIMGTMSNTLILAYTGSSIPLLLLFMAYDTSLNKIMNLDLIATEIVRALAGSIGIIVAIPITAFVTGLILKYKKFETADYDMD